MSNDCKHTGAGSGLGYTQTMGTNVASLLWLHSIVIFQYSYMFIFQSSETAM